MKPTGGAEDILREAMSEARSRTKGLRFKVEPPPRRLTKGEGPRT
jgi:hypothetical protein